MYDNSEEMKKQKSVWAVAWPWGLGIAIVLLVKNFFMGDVMLELAIDTLVNFLVYTAIVALIVFLYRKIRGI